MVHLDLNTGGQAEGLVVPTVGRGCVQAKYDFTGRAADELTFKKGDVILLTDSSDDAWWQGEYLGQQGMFPASYVSKKKRKADRKQKSRAQVTVAGGVPEQVKARQDYTAEHPDELTFAKGDIIAVSTDAVNASSDWWVGELDGKSGKFLKALVKGPKSGTRKPPKGTQEAAVLKDPKMEQQKESQPSMAPQPPRKKAGGRKKRPAASNARKIVGGAPEYDDVATNPSSELLKEVEKLKLELEFQKFKEAQQKGKHRKKKKLLKKQTNAATRVQATYRGYRARAQMMDPEDEGGDDDDIESLVGHRIKRGQMQLRVRWKGAGPEEDEWFPLSALLEEHGGAVRHYLALQSGVQSVVEVWVETLAAVRRADRRRRLRRPRRLPVAPEA